MVNREIKSKVVDVINESGKGLQRMSLDDAIKLAEKTDEDVICINNNGDVPVVKLGSYSKYLYAKEKKAKENRKKARQNSQDIKEINIGDTIAEHDMKIKAKNATRILNEGDKVRLSIKYKGRSIRYIDQGPAKLDKLMSFIDTDYNIDKKPKIEGNKVTMLISPNKKKKGVENKNEIKN